MRDILALLDGERLDVRATVVRLSKRVGWAGVREPTILLGQVCTLDGALLTDHLWLNLGKRLAVLDLHKGDVVGFSGRVASYRKGLARLPGEPAQFSIDYGLAYPTRCVVLARAPKPEPEQAPTIAPAPMIPVVDAFKSATVADLPIGPKALPRPAALPAVPPRTRILAALAPLCQQAEPPSLKHLYAHTPMAPTAFLGHLHKLAKIGAIAFAPNGRVFLASTSATTEGSISS